MFFIKATIVKNKDKTTEQQLFKKTNQKDIFDSLRQQQKKESLYRLLLIFRTTNLLTKTIHFFQRHNFLTIMKNQQINENNKFKVYEKNILQIKNKNKFSEFQLKQYFFLIFLFINFTLTPNQSVEKKHIYQNKNLYIHCEKKNIILYP